MPIGKHWPGVDPTKIKDPRIQRAFVALDNWNQHVEAQIAAITSGSTVAGVASVDADNGTPRTGAISLISTAAVTVADLGGGDFSFSIDDSGITHDNTGGAAASDIHDHGLLQGLTDDDHLQYLNRTGVRPMTGELGTDVGTFRSDVASGGIGFALNTSNSFIAGHIFQFQDNGSRMLEQNFEGHVSIIGSDDPANTINVLTVTRDLVNDNRSVFRAIGCAPTISGTISGVIWSPVIIGVDCTMSVFPTTVPAVFPSTRVVRGGQFSASVGGRFGDVGAGSSKVVGGRFTAFGGSGNEPLTGPAITEVAFGLFEQSGSWAVDPTDVYAIKAPVITIGTNRWGASLRNRTEISSPVTDAQEVLKLNQLNTGATDGVHIKLNDKAGEATNTVTGDIWRNGNLVKFFDGLVINEGGVDADTRIEGATEANLLYIDAGNNRIGIGTATPDTTLTVNGDMNILSGSGLVIGHNAKIDFGAIPEFQVVGTATPDSSMGLARFENNASGPDVRFLKSRGSAIGVNTIVQDGDTLGRFRFQGADTVDFNTTAAQISAEVDGTPAANNIPGRLIFTTRTSGGSLDEKMRITNAGIIGVGLTAPTGKLHVDQASASGAIPVLRLDQGDIDDTFIDFIGTSAADGSRSISSDTTEDSAKFGAIRVEINGVTKWVRVYDNES